MKNKKAVKIIIVSLASVTLPVLVAAGISGDFLSFGKTSDTAQSKPDMKFSVEIEENNGLVDTVPMGIGLRGDSDGDEKLSVRDAAFIARYRANASMNPNYLPDFEGSLDGAMADADADGKVSVRDAAAVARFLSQKYYNPDLKWSDIVK